LKEMHQWAKIRRDSTNYLLLLSRWLVQQVSFQQDDEAHIRGLISSSFSFALTSPDWRPLHIAGPILVAYGGTLDGRGLRLCAGGSRILYVARSTSSPLWGWEDVYNLPRDMCEYLALLN
jgi:hypothetical protein